MKRCKDASSIKQQRLFKRRWRRWGHKAITIIAVLSVSLCQCVPQQARQNGNSTGMFNLQDYSYYYDTTGGQRDYSTGSGQFAEYTQQSHDENKQVGAAPQYENRDYQYWSSDHNEVTEERILNRGNKTHNQNTWHQGPTGQPSSDRTPAPKWSQADLTDLSSAKQQVLPPEKNEGNNENYEGPHFWYDDRWNQSYHYDQTTIAPKVYGYPEDDANYHHNLSSYQQQQPVEQSWNYNGYFQGNAENSMQNPQNVWEQSEGQFEDNKNEIDDVFAQHIATIYEEDMTSGHNNNPGQKQNLKHQYSQQHNQDEHYREQQPNKHQAQQIHQHQIRPQGQNQQQHNSQQWAQINKPEKKQQLVTVQQNQQQDNAQWDQMQLNQPENKQQFIREQQNQQQYNQQKTQPIQAQQNQQQKWLKQQQQLQMGPQSQQQQSGVGQQNQQQQLGMGQHNQQLQVGMGHQSQQQQQLEMGHRNQQQQQLGMWHQSQQQQQLGMGHQSQQQQQLGMGHQSQQLQQLGMGQHNQQLQVGMGHQRQQQQQLGMGHQSQQQDQLGKDQQSQQQQLEKDEQAKKDELIQQILSHHYQKSREEMPQNPTMNDAKLNGRPKPNSFTRFPVRQPSKILRWQMAIRNRFQNHIDESKRRKESEERGTRNQIQTQTQTPLAPEYGTSIVDSFAESAVMPGAFLAFCMLFMDILNRLMPFTFNSTPTTTTTTTRPPKIVKYEWTPPKIPTVVDMLEHMSDKFSRLKAFKLKKKSKKKKWMASSEEDKWRGLPLEGTSKRKRKKGGKRTTKAPKLSLKRLEDLYQIYKPDYIKNNQLSYLL